MPKVPKPVVRKTKTMKKRKKVVVACPQCAIMLRGSNIGRHIRISHSGGQFHCRECTCVFNTAGALGQHKRLHRPPIVNAPQVVVAPVQAPNEGGGVSHSITEFQPEGFQAKPTNNQRVQDDDTAEIAKLNARLTEFATAKSALDAASKRETVLHEKVVDVETQMTKLNETHESEIAKLKETVDDERKAAEVTRQLLVEKSAAEVQAIKTSASGTSSKVVELEARIVTLTAESEAHATTAQKLEEEKNKLVSKPDEEYDSDAEIDDALNMQDKRYGQYIASMIKTRRCCSAKLKRLIGEAFTQVDEECSDAESSNDDSLDIKNTSGCSVPVGVCVYARYVQSRLQRAQHKHYTC